MKNAVVRPRTRAGDPYSAPPLCGLPVVRTLDNLIKPLSICAGLPTNGAVGQAQPERWYYEERGQCKQPS